MRDMRENAVPAPRRGLALATMAVCALGSFVAANAQPRLFGFPNGGAFVWNGSSLTQVTDASALTCDHWAVWYFDTLAKLPGMQWGEDTGPSAQAVLKAQKDADLFDREYARFFGTIYPPLKYSHHIFTAPICVTSDSVTAKPEALKQLQRVGEISGRLAKEIDSASTMLFAYNHGADLPIIREVVNYFKQVKQLADNVARLHTQIMSSLNVPLESTESALAEMDRQLDAMGAKTNGGEAAASTSAQGPAKTSSFSGGQYHFSNRDGSSLDVTLKVDGGLLVVDETNRHVHFASHLTDRAPLQNVRVTNIVQKTLPPGSSPSTSFMVYVSCGDNGSCITGEGENYNGHTDLSFNPNTDQRSNDRISGVSIYLASEGEARALCERVNTGDDSLCQAPIKTE